MGCSTVRQHKKRNQELEVVQVVSFEEILNIPALQFGETEEGIIIPQCLLSSRRVQLPMKSNISKYLNQSPGLKKKRVTFSPVCSQAKIRLSKSELTDVIEVRFDINNFETQ